MTPLKVWHGKADLPKVFWIFGVVGEMIVGLPFLALLLALTDVPDNETASLLMVYLIAVLFYTCWIFVGIWRCAGNYDNDNGLKQVARFCVLAGSFIFVIFIWQILFAAT